MKNEAKKEIKIGTRVMCNGYEGTVISFYSESMVEVRLNAGVACVDVTNFSGQYKDNYII